MSFYLFNFRHNVAVDAPLEELLTCETLIEECRSDVRFVRRLVEPENLEKLIHFVVFPLPEPAHPDSKYK